MNTSGTAYPAFKMKVLTSRSLTCEKISLETFSASPERSATIIRVSTSLFLLNNKN